MRGTGHETGGLMTAFHKEQALARYIELWERRRGSVRPIPGCREQGRAWQRRVLFER
jgi:hypothetical protein